MPAKSKRKRKVITAAAAAGRAEEQATDAMDVIPDTDVASSDNETMPPVVQSLPKLKKIKKFRMPPPPSPPTRTPPPPPNSPPSSPELFSQNYVAKAKNINLTPEQDDHLANWFKERPFLYDLRERDYKNESKKREEWKSLANVFGCDWEYLAKYAKGLRDRVGKLLRREEGASGSSPAAFTDREIFILEKYRFLREHLRRVSDSRKRRTSVGLQRQRSYTPDDPPPLPSMEGADEEANTSSSFNTNRVSSVSL